MDEERVKKAVEFLQDKQIKDVAHEEKIVYLKNKLTEEELSEALTRLDTGNNSPNTVSVQRTPAASERRYSSSQSLSHPEPVVQHQSSTGSKVMKALNIGAISAASSIAISYMINNMKDKKEQEIFQCMKDFQEQNINQLKTEVDMLKEENYKLRTKMLTEADVKMIASKTIANNSNGRPGSGDDNGRRKSQSFNEPISLQLKGGRRQNNNMNKSSNNRQSLANSTDSDLKKESSFELMEQMNKFLKSSQENNAEMMREMKNMHQNMSSCFTTMSMALNKLSTKLEPSAPVKEKQNPFLRGRTDVTTKTNHLVNSNPSSQVKVNEEKKQENTKETGLKDLTMQVNGVKPPTLEDNDPVQVDPSQDPKIEDETENNDPPVDDILTVGAEVNQPQEEDSKTNIDDAGEQLEHVSIEDVEAVATQFIESLSDLSEGEWKIIAKTIGGNFTTMKRVSSNNNALKINLDNKLMKKIVDSKREEFVHLLEAIGFKEKNKSLYEAADPDFVRKVLNETNFVDTFIAAGNINSQ